MSACTSWGEGLVSLSASSHAGEAASLHELGGVSHICVHFFSSGVHVCLSASEPAMERHVYECAHIVNILTLVSLRFRIVVCLSCLWSVVCGSGPLSLHPLEWRPGTLPLLPPELRQIYLRQRDPEMKSLSLWGDGKLSSRTTPQNKTKALSTLAPQVPTERTPTFLSPPSHTPRAPQHLWPLKEASPWESLSGLCCCHHQKNQLSLQAWGEGCLVEVWREGGGGSYLGLGGGGLSCLGSHSPLLTLASPHPTAAASPRKSWNVWVSLG